MTLDIGSSLVIVLLCHIGISSCTVSNYCDMINYTDKLYKVERKECEILCTWLRYSPQITHSFITSAKCYRLSCTHSEYSQYKRVRWKANPWQVLGPVSSLPSPSLSGLLRGSSGVINHRLSMYRLPVWTNTWHWTVPNGNFQTCSYALAKLCKQLRR